MMIRMLAASTRLASLEADMNLNLRMIRIRAASIVEFVVGEEGALSAEIGRRA